jgi:two-component sensor histidine kinase
VKNTLAVVQGIAHLTFKSAKTLPGAEADLAGRIAAVASAHELLSAERWTKASMVEIVKAALGGCGTSIDRFAIEGRDFSVRSETAVSIALAIHELCTNAYKYGALSNAEGHVKISWHVTGDTPPKFFFQWLERDGPLVTPPLHKGFGTKVLQRGLGSELGGELHLDYRVEGLVMTFLAPIPQEPISDPGRL